MVAHVLATTAIYYGNIETKVALGIVFRKRRPDYHFIDSNRTNCVKICFTNAPVTGGDIENMAKFVLIAC